MWIIEPGPEAAQQIERLRAAGYRYLDAWDTARQELTVLSALTSPPDALPAGPIAMDEAGLEGLSRYAVYPWRNTVVRLPRQELFHALRTSRNRHLISDDAQSAWSEALVGVAGLSVGSAAAIACGLTGARRLRIADGDVLGITNLNRVPFSVCDLGERKSELTRRRLLETDPYTRVEVFDTALGESSADEFLGDGAERLAVLIEEIDDVAAKVLLRRRAREQRIPVVMATDLADDVVVDIERFDLDPNTPILGGRLDRFADADLGEPSRRLELAAALIADVAPPALFTLPVELGRTLASWPQLGTTAMQAGAIAALAARLVVSGAQLPSGRYRTGAQAIFGMPQ